MPPRQTSVSEPPFSFVHTKSRQSLAMRQSDISRTCAPPPIRFLSHTYLASPPPFSLPPFYRETLHSSWGRPASRRAKSLVRHKRAPSAPTLRGVTRSVAETMPRHLVMVDHGRMRCVRHSRPADSTEPHRSPSRTAHQRLTAEIRYCN